MRPGTALFLAALAGTACGGGTAGEPVTLLEYGAVRPERWKPRPPANTMRLAEYVGLAPEGEEPPEVVVYYFGPGQGGSAEANIARWGSQFTGTDGQDVEPRVTRLESVAFPTTVAEFEGTYARGIGMGPDREDAEAGQALVAAVVETPRGNLFIQLFGPLASVEAERDAFHDFVRSIAPDGETGDTRSDRPDSGD